MAKKKEQAFGMLNEKYCTELLGKAGFVKIAKL